MDITRYNEVAKLASKRDLTLVDDETLAEAFEEAKSRLNKAKSMPNGKRKTVLLKAVEPIHQELRYETNKRKIKDAKISGANIRKHDKQSFVTSLI